MTDFCGTGGLKLSEPLIWERHRQGRSAFSMPAADVPAAPLPGDLTGGRPDIPDVSEIDLVRHYTRMAAWNMAIDLNMYPLGSCTMKYNPKTHERQAALPGFQSAHPMVPDSLNQGALTLMHRLARYLGEITGLPAVSLAPAAGAHGELTGMLIIHAHHQRLGRQRTKIIIPDTAHGTNPASAALCGYKPVPLASSADGVISAADVAALMDEDTAGIMITNPNTIGLFEADIREITRIVHDCGGLVYGDGANLNAVMGIVDVGRIGIDMLHINLHKTFATPHGGGGPGAGPVCVTEALAPLLPVPRIVETGEHLRLDWDVPESIGQVGSFYGHFGILVRAYSYIRTLGAAGLERVSRMAVLNANYVRQRLKSDFHLAYDRTCMHECVFSDKRQAVHKVSTLDIAKRLMDYGFHPPTIYFPLIVHGALMIEPTETESMEELDRFIDAMRTIAREAIEDPDLVRNAPHRTRIRRLDEVAAARKPCLKG